MSIYEKLNIEKVKHLIKNTKSYIKILKNEYYIHSFI